MMQTNFLFDAWDPLVRIVVVGVPMYVSLVLLLRISRSRTLASMNAFDFVITVAIGAVFGRALTASAVSLSEALLAFALLVSLQYVVTWIQFRSPLFERVVTNPPALLYFQGEFLRTEMRRQRVTESGLRTAARKDGYATLENVAAIVLESSGEFSVVGTVESADHFEESLDEGLGEGVDEGIDEGE
jgi:uncharacterized membrane protein YcaP (DUF421 family)